MISPYGARPILLLPDGRNTLYTKDWLNQCAKELAGFTGEDASNVAAALAFYLQHEHQSSVIELKEIEALLKSCSSQLTEVNTSSTRTLTKTEISVPPQHIYLSDLAQEAGTGFQIGFLQLLEKQLEKIRSSLTQIIHIWGLHEGVTQLLPDSTKQFEPIKQKEQRHLEKEILSLFNSPTLCNSRGEKITVIIEKL